jgi:hypothetical protein
LFLAAKTKDPGNVAFDTRVLEVVSKYKFPGNVHSDTTKTMISWVPSLI